MIEKARINGIDRFELSKKKKNLLCKSNNK